MVLTVRLISPYVIVVLEPTVTHGIRADPSVIIYIYILGLPFRTPLFSDN